MTLNNEMCDQKSTVYEMNQYSINSHVLHYSYTMHQNGKKKRFYICNLKHTFEIYMPFFLYCVSFTQSKQNMNTLQLESLCLHSISKMLSFHKIRENPCRTSIKTDLSYLSGMSKITVDQSLSKTTMQAVWKTVLNQIIWKSLSNHM